MPCIINPDLERVVARPRYDVGVRQDGAPSRRDERSTCGSTGRRRRAESAVSVWRQAPLDTSHTLSVSLDPDMTRPFDRTVTSLRPARRGVDE